MRKLKCVAVWPLADQHNGKPRHAGCETRAIDVYRCQTCRELRPAARDSACPSWVARTTEDVVIWSEFQQLSGLRELSGLGDAASLRRLPPVSLSQTQTDQPERELRE